MSAHAYFVKILQISCKKSRVGWLYEGWLVISVFYFGTAFIEVVLNWLLRAK